MRRPRYRATRFLHSRRNDNMPIFTPAWTKEGSTYESIPKCFRRRHGVVAAGRPPAGALSLIGGELLFQPLEELKTRDSKLETSREGCHEGATTRPDARAVADKLGRGKTGFEFAILD